MNHEHDIINKHGTMICSVCGESYDAIRRAYLEKQNKELMEALEEIIEQCEVKMGEWSSVQLPYLPDDMTGYYYIIETARAAIAKAEKART